jgi:hypothetical protein
MLPPPDFESLRPEVAEPGDAVGVTKNAVILLSVPIGVWALPFTTAVVAA